MGVETIVSAVLQAAQASGLMDKLAQETATQLAAKLPDVAEDVLGDFMISVGTHLKAAN